MNASTPRVHWLGAGLSSVPGIRRLAGGSLPLTLWNRTLEKAEAAVAGLDAEVTLEKFELSALKQTINKGDIVVSMLPGNWHMAIAGLCLEKVAHFVSSSYISAEMAALHDAALDKQLCLVNEVGLDPGLDHLMAHALVRAYKESGACQPDNTLYFRSYCGGFPAVPDDFCYKFSWSPLGVLKALKSPSRSLRDGQVLDIERPWQAISRYTAILPGNRRESFETYPNRDALPFIKAYHFEPGWRVEEFVRGTLRLPGWANAWQPIFKEVDQLEGEAGEQRLREMSAQLWDEQAYAPGEADRVVLCVELKARNDSESAWHRAYSIDAIGNKSGSAMARLVSWTVSFAIDALAVGKIAAGVSAAPSDPLIIAEWFLKLEQLGEKIEALDLAEKK